jgi:hypothetical protein
LEVRVNLVVQGLAGVGLILSKLLDKIWKGFIVSTLRMLIDFNIRRGRKE